MLYVQESLGTDEELIHVANFHWMYNVSAVMNIFWGMAAAVLLVVGGTFAYQQMGHFPPNITYMQAIPHLHPGVKIMAFLMVVMGLLSFAQMMITKATTEIAVTNHRMIYKVGLVARRVGEISIDRIEGVNVLQSLLGRIFNFGRLAVRGTGVGEVVLPPIEDPIKFRKAIQYSREQRIHNAKEVITSV